MTLRRLLMDAGWVLMALGFVFGAMTMAEPRGGLLGTPWGVWSAYCFLAVIAVGLALWRYCPPEDVGQGGRQ